MRNRFYLRTAAFTQGNSLKHDFRSGLRESLQLEKELDSKRFCHYTSLL